MWESLKMDSDDDDDYGLPVGGSSGLQGREDLNQESLDPSAARQAFKGKYLRPGGKLSNATFLLVEPSSHAVTVG